MAFDYALITNETDDEIKRSVSILSERLRQFRAQIETESTDGNANVKDLLHSYQSLMADCDLYVSLAGLHQLIDSSDKSFEWLYSLTEQLKYSCESTTNALVRFLYRMESAGYTLDAYSANMINKLVRANGLSGKQEIDEILPRIAQASSSSWRQLRSNLLARAETTEGISFSKSQSMLNDPCSRVRKGGFDATKEICEPLITEVRLALLGIKRETQLVSGIKGFNSVLDMSLFQQGLSKDSLDKTLAALHKIKPALMDYMLLKSKNDGADAIKWYNMLNSRFQPSVDLSMKDAVKTIHEALRESLGVDELSLSALTMPGLVDHEERQRKRNGACSNNVYKSKHTFIMLTYNNTVKDFISLAHELGHAFLNSLLADNPFITASAPSVVSEMVAIFVELLASEALLRANPSSRITILESRLNHCVSTFMLVYSRYLFEKRLFEAIEEDRPITTSTLMEIMLKAQQDTYQSEDEQAYQPYEWVVKPHFYYPARPYYNYQYIIGRFAAFEMLLNIKSGQSGPDDYREKLINVFRQSGKNTSEDTLTQITDLAAPEIWNKSVAYVTEMVEDYKRSCGELQ